MICHCTGCFRRIPENTAYCTPCSPPDAWHGPGGEHGYHGGLDETQMQAIHTLLEVIDHGDQIPLSRALTEFYQAFRGG